MSIAHLMAQLADATARNEALTRRLERVRDLAEYWQRQSADQLPVQQLLDVLAAPDLPKRTSAQETSLLAFARDMEEQG